MKLQDQRYTQYVQRHYISICKKTQEELAQAYQEEMAAKHQEINNQTARQWLLDYENRNLYQ